MTLLRVIDFETTGMPPDAAICEIGFCDVKVDQSSITVGVARSTLVFPGCPIPVEATAVHHITEEDVMKAPRAEEVLPRMHAGKPDYFVAHNADFERAFFPGDGVPWLCTYKIARHLYPEAPGHSNQVLRYFFKILIGSADAMPPHRAGPDAFVTAHLLARFIAAAHKAELSLADLHRISMHPALLRTINYGKHKGSTYEAAPLDYLQWIVDKSEMGPDEKHTAAYWIRKRVGA